MSTSSSGRSGKKRRRKRSRSKSKSSIRGRKKTNSPLVNFFAMISGMILSLLIIAFTYNYVTAEKILPVDQPGIASDFELDEGGGVSNFDEILESGNADKIHNTIRGISQMRLATKAAPFAIDMLTKQTRLADKILEISDDERYIKAAINAKLTAAQVMYGIDSHRQMNMEAVAATLRNAAEPYIDYPDPEIALSAQLAMSKLHVFEFGKNKTDSNFQIASDSVQFLVEKHPEDIVVIDTVQTLLIRCLDDAPDQTMALLDRILSKQPDVPSVARLVSNVRGHAMLNQVGFSQLTANYWANGDRGREEFREKTLELAARNDIGLVVVNRIGESIDWLERNNELDLARELANSLVEQSRNYTDLRSQEQARTLGSQSLARTSMIGKKFELGGDFVRNTKVEKFDSHGSVKVILFFSNNDTCRQYIKAIAQLSNKKDSAQIAMIAVSEDEENQEDVDNFSALATRWWFVVDDEDRNLTNHISSQYPVASCPHIVVIDTRGNVKRINVPLEELANVIEEARMNF